jgi:thiol-disulfide isomerase/thioredoxin
MLFAVFSPRRSRYYRSLIPVLWMFIPWFALTLLGPSPARGQRLQPMPNRLPAPGLDGPTEWLNTATPLDLRELRGKFVVLDFWTYCCVNCLHMLPELKKLEQAFPQQIVVIGVHSGKFETERDVENIRKAVLRHDIRHPVVNDDQQILWNRYNVTAWPSIRIVDPHGFLIAAHTGEIRFDILNDFFLRAMPLYLRQGALNINPMEFDLEQSRAQATPLRFPGKVLADPSSKRVFIADSAHHRIVVASMDGKLLDVVGTGVPGREDGPFDQVRFRQPRGMAIDGDLLYVADTENHLIRKVDLKEKTVGTLAGTGRQAGLYPIRGRPTGPLQVDIASPWDLYLQGKTLYIAMAGTHQIWKMDLDDERIGPFAGSGMEDVIDGALIPSAKAKSVAALAQPSGLTSNGRWLFVADAEGSSIRAVPMDEGAQVMTVLGTSKLPDQRLFTFGDQDGPLSEALLQHPLGIAWWNQGLLVADTYNHKIKFIQPRGQTVVTLGGDGTAGKTNQPVRFDEPSGLSVAGQHLYIADTNNHLVRIMDLIPPYRVRSFAVKGLTAPPPSANEGEPPAEVPVSPANRRGRAPRRRAP